MNLVEINKILSNQVRLDILDWLKKPEKNFPQQIDLPDFKAGVSMYHIQYKANLSRSTVSQYLNMMHKIEFVTAVRDGKSIYYRRNESKISEYIQALSQTL